MRFKDKIAIVTGGASGIGKEVATRFVAEGGSVVINGRNGAKAEAAAREIDPTGKRVVVHTGDIALPATSDAVVKTAIGQFGRVDVLFNNAGIFAPKPFLETNEVEYDRFLDIILKGKFFAAQAAAKAMKASGRGGAIVQTGSMWALEGDRRDSVGSLFSGERRRPCAGQEPRDRAGSRQDSRERDRTRGDRNPGVRHVPHARAGENCAADLQRNAPAWPQRPASGCSRSAAVSRLRSGEFHYRRRSPCRRRRYGRPAIVGGSGVRSSETRDASWA
jgi:NAD(P)-dependent dehydrogenase (short-subunit alcohol dehydrogenase family)